ncbi:MAG: hypothetical protein ACK5HR_03385 [Mycoplasmatales bacterium]
MDIFEDDEIEEVDESEWEEFDKEFERLQRSKSTKHKKKNTKALYVDLSVDLKSKLKEICKKENKTQTEVISTFIKDYEVYKKTIYSIEDDVKVLLKVLDITSDYEVSKVKLELEEQYQVKSENRRVKKFGIDKKPQYLRLSTHEILNELAIKENRNKNEIVDELLLNYYYKTVDNKNIVYQIKDMLKVFQEISKRQLGDKVYNKIEKTYFRNKFSNKKYRKGGNIE